MIAVWTSLAPGTQWSHIPIVRVPAALALRTNGAATRPAATPPATTPRRDNLLDGMTIVLPEGTCAHEQTLGFLSLGTGTAARSDGWRASSVYSAALSLAAYRRWRQTRPPGPGPP